MRLCGADWKSGEPVPLAELEGAARELASREGKPIFITRPLSRWKGSCRW
jgi:hypothetical protein